MMMRGSQGFGRGVCASIGIALMVAVPGITPEVRAETPASVAVTPVSIPAWMRALNLSPDQLTKIQAIEAKYKPQAQAEQAQLNQAESLLESLLVKGANNEDIRAQHQVIQNYRRQLEVTRLEAALEIKDVLTPAQRQQLADMNQQRLQRLRDQLLGSSTAPK